GQPPLVPPRKEKMRGK
nr:Chain D, MITOGEN-ACTIVATED PROTEIN KINASE KINASE KINASE KINASE 1 [Mus musculus]